MKSKQFKGPFSVDESIDLGLSGVKYVQIGIEYPHSIPISEATPSTVLSINNINYYITEKDTLEFEQLNLDELSIIVREANDPYIIIDVVYK